MLAIAILAIATCLPEVLGGLVEVEAKQELTAKEATVVAVLRKLVEVGREVQAFKATSVTKTVNRQRYGNTTALILESFKKQNLALGLTFINVVFVSIYVIVVSLCALITKIRKHNEKKQQEMFEMFEQKHKDQKRENQKDSRSRRRSEPRGAATASLA